MLAATHSLVVLVSLVSTVMASPWLPWLPHHEYQARTAELSLAQYAPGPRQPVCHTETWVEFRNWCEPYSEETCWTQNQETCVSEEYRNCTGVIETEVERVCFDVTELLCSLEEATHYEVVEESYQLMHCFTAADRVCDTVYNIDTLTKDNYQCLTVETPSCYQEEQIIYDVTCTDSLEFQCDRKMMSMYGIMEVVCARFPKKDCYNVPRKVLVEVCTQDQYQYCDKFTNLVPYPVEEQNCHFEPKKICEIREMSSPKQAKKYSYTKECKKVNRQLCDQVEKKTIMPNCGDQERLKCTYEPVKKCEEKDKVYCEKQEVVMEEEVCDKNAINYL